MFIKDALTYSLVSREPLLILSGISWYLMFSQGLLKSDDYMKDLQVFILHFFQITHCKEKIILIFNYLLDVYWWKCTLVGYKESRRKKKNVRFFQNKTVLGMSSVTSFVTLPSPSMDGHVTPRFGVTSSLCVWVTQHNLRIGLHLFYICVFSSLHPDKRKLNFCWALV